MNFLNPNLNIKFLKPASWLTPVFVPCFHLLILFLTYKLLLLSGFIKIIDPFFLKQWDAYYYASIAEKGYEYSAVKASNSGFFPLFSYEWKVLWKLFGAGIEGVCWFNILTFFTGMLLLKRTFNFSWGYFLLFVSIPSNMFMYVPYTESTFFFFSVLILSGLKTNNKAWVLTGLFFASLTKPTAIFFIPAILCMEVVVGGDIKKSLKRTLAYLLAPILGTLSVVIFQFKVTGVWFAYFKTQSYFLKRTMQWPELPFTTWDGLRVLWLDGFALFFGLLATGLLVAFIIRRLRRLEITELDKPTVFSLCYLMLALFSILFFNGKDNNGGTSLMGANRYLLATPYFILMLLFMSHAVKFKASYWIGYITLAIAMVFLFRVDATEDYLLDSYDKFYYRLLIILYIGVFLLIHKHFKNTFIAMIYIINVIIQVIIMHQFAYAKWIG